MFKKIIFMMFLLGMISCGKGISLDGTDGSSTTAVNASVCSAGGFCMIFLSNTVRDGDVDAIGNNNGNGIEEADSTCNNDSNKPNSSTYKALIVDGTNRIACTTANCGGGPGEHTDWIMEASREYRRSDGTTVIGTTTANGIFTFNITNSIVGVATQGWTGLNANWTGTGQDCANWTDNTGGNGTVGLGDQVDATSIAQSNQGCNVVTRGYFCVEQP